MIPDYPESTELTPALRPLLHPLFQALEGGISEMTFANLYLFRSAHNYRISTLKGGQGGNYVITGTDNEEPFFMLPFALPAKDLLNRLFIDLHTMKAISSEQALKLEEMGYRVMEDRDNFDYLYSREEMTGLGGRKFHKKRNLVSGFLGEYSCQARPLLDEHLGDALEVLDKWQEGRDGPGDFHAAKQALSMMDELQLCGGIYHVDGTPVAYTLGEEIARGSTFVIHFEKGVGGYKGLMQFVNKSFAAILPDKYEFINREQDLGIEGLRQAKMSYRPKEFIKKYRITL